VTLAAVDSQAIMSMACHEIVDEMDDKIMEHYQVGSGNPHQVLCDRLAVDVSLICLFNAIGWCIDAEIKAEAIREQKRKEAAAEEAKRAAEAGENDEGDQDEPKPDPPKPKKSKSKKKKTTVTAAPQHTDEL
jgi:hypothetical protein